MATKFKPLQEARSSLRLPTVGTLAGIADCVQIVGYISGIGPMPFNALAIAIKIALVVISGAPSKAATSGLVFTATLSGLSLISYGFSPYQDASTMIQLMAFFVSLSLTVVLTAGGTRLEEYARAFVNTICATNALYLVELVSGGIEATAERYFYFSGNHPNLGSEISAMAVVVACIYFHRRGLLARLPILFAPMLLMQGRAGILTGLLAVAISAAHEIHRLHGKNSVFTVAAVSVVTPTFLYVSYGYLVSLYRAIFLVDDYYRGEGTGFVGRSDRWNQALSLFLDRPLIGNGAAVYDVLGIASPHNYFLYGIANLGVLFAFIIVLLFYHAYRAARFDFRAAQVFGATAVMLVFNDRFANLAPYPFTAYVILLGLSAQMGLRRRRWVRIRVSPPTANTVAG